MTADLFAYTLTAVVALLAVAWRTGLHLSPAAVAIGLAVSAVSHYVVDRRAPLRWMADRLGKDAAWQERGGGLYALGQSWHVGWLFVVALVVSS